MVLSLRFLVPELCLCCSILAGAFTSHLNKAVSDELMCSASAPTERMALHHFLAPSSKLLLPLLPCWVGRQYHLSSRSLSLKPQEGPAGRPTDRLLVTSPAGAFSASTGSVPLLHTAIALINPLLSRPPKPHPPYHCQKGGSF